MFNFLSWIVYTHTDFVKKNSSFKLFEIFQNKKPISLKVKKQGREGGKKKEKVQRREAIVNTESFKMKVFSEWFGSLIENWF